MTKGQAIKYSLIYLLLILLGVFIAFKVWWTKGDERFLGIISFFLVGFGSLFLSISLTRILIPSNTNFSFSTLSDKQNYKILKETIGATKVKIINLTYICLFFMFFAGTAYILITSLNKYEQFQLKTYGQLQKVAIKDIHYKGKGTQYAYFDFYLNGKIYTNDLDPKNYSIGDSVTIIFSTNNPDIVKWEEDYDNNEN